MENAFYSTKLSQPVETKVAELGTGDRLQHLVLADQISKQLFVRLASVADQIRELASSQDGRRFLLTTLSDRRAMLYFTQTSTRTFLSFVAACELLGMSHAEVRDPSLSSEMKGEHPLDSMRMFSSYFDAVIVRDRNPGFAETCAYMMNSMARNGQRAVPIINGGSGADEHPTQALLDLYTIERSFQFEDPNERMPGDRYRRLRAKYPSLRRGIEGKRYLFCGDIGRGRTVRSLASLLARFAGAELHFVSPAQDGLRLSAELRKRLEKSGSEVFEHEDLDAILPEVDLVYMTRLQSEHGASDEIDWSKYVLTAERLAIMRDYAPIMHPFPRNDEVPFEIDDDPRAMYFRQARNGMWIRAALLAHLFDVESTISETHRQRFSTYHDYNTGVLKA